MALVARTSRAALRFGARLDAEHYSPRFDEVLNRLRGNRYSQLRRQLCEPVATGHTPSTKEPRFYEPGVAAFVKTDNVREDRIETGSAEKLSAAGAAVIGRAELQPGDVVVTIIGATEDVVGRAALVTADVGRAYINQNVARIRSELLPGYLTAFLNCRYGRGQLFWLSRQTGQINLNCLELGELLVPRFSERLERTLHAMSVERHRLLTDAERMYDTARMALLTALGVGEWRRRAVGSFVVELGAVVSRRRLDGEHFDPQAAGLVEAAKEAAAYWRVIRDIRDVSTRGLQPEYAAGGSLQVITSKHILERHLA